MRRGQLSDRSSSSSVTDNEYIDMDSNGNSYRTEPTVFDSNTDSDANSDADYNADSGINCDANSITRFNNACEAPA
jgi:hypothetical protein